jgi:hypothetical protein
MKKHTFCRHIASLNNKNYLNKKIYKIKIISFTNNVFSFFILKENEIDIIYNFTDKYAEKYYNLYLESNE